MSSEPIFKMIFGKQWQHLPPVMKKHYANRPFSKDVRTVTGVMEVHISPWVKCVAPLLKLTKTLIPLAGSDIKAVVHFRSEKDSRMFCFDRTFTFPDGSVYKFYSRMEPIGDNEVVEWTHSGIGWHAFYSFDGKRVLLQHKGYCVTLFGRCISLPISWLLGKAKAYEIAIDEKTFDMAMHIIHPLFGNLYSYSGKFEVQE